MFDGAWLLFGIVLLPVYGMLAGWFLDKPRNHRVALLGVGFLLGVTLAMWLGLAVVAELLGLLFF